jgi:hypothetical protein
MILAPDTGGDPFRPDTLDASGRGVESKHTLVDATVHFLLSVFGRGVVERLSKTDEGRKLVANVAGAVDAVRQSATVDAHSDDQAA